MLKKQTGTNWGHVTPLTVPITLDDDISIEVTFDDIIMFGAVGLYLSNSVWLPETIYSGSEKNVGIYGYGSTNSWLVPIESTYANVPVTLKYEIKDGLINIYGYNEDTLMWSYKNITPPSVFNNRDLYLTVSLPMHFSSSNYVYFKDVLIKSL